MLRGIVIGIALGLVSGLPWQGCRQPKIHLSPPNGIHPSLRGMSEADLAAMFTRKSKSGSINISAMLWDRAYVGAYLGRLATAKGWPAPVLKTKTSEWSKRYLLGRTTFRIRLELLNRPLTVTGRDPLLELDRWQWRLTDSLGRTRSAIRADTDTKQMFRGSQGRYNWRVLGNVTFEGRPDPTKERWIQLVALPPGDHLPIRLPRWYLSH